jgi:hypothetical protein
MHRAKLSFHNHVGVLRKSVTIALLLTSGLFAIPGVAQEKGQKTFSAPEEAGHALYTAAKNNDENALLEILGSAAKQILYSGDEREDAESRTTFIEGYKEMHRFVMEPNGTVNLYIGGKNWPSPIPIVNNGNTWYFDTEAGGREILFRRIGRNEISAIHICHELAAAEKEFSQAHHEYAQKIFSDEGMYNGLYWQRAESQPESPIGPLVAQAVTNERRGSTLPYRGYFFHIVTRQGKNAPGGAQNYIVRGKMTGGFAFVAYPAEYRSSGVKTFLVSTDGVVFEKDLGKNTEAIARSMQTFNPDSSWQRVETKEKP